MSSSTTSSTSASFTSVRSKARSNLSKNLPGDFPDRIDAKLYLKSDKDEAVYRQLFKLTTQLLRDDSIREDIVKGRVGLNDFFTRVLQQKKTAEEDLKELEWELNEEKAVQLQKEKEIRDAPLVNAVKVAKAASADKITDPAGFSRVGDASMQLFLVGSPNLSYSHQAQKAFARAETLDKDESFRKSNYFNFHIKRAFLHLCHFELAEAISTLENGIKFHEKAEKKNEFYVTVAKERIDSIQKYFKSIKSAVDSSAGRSAYEMKKVLKEIPKTAATVSERKMVTFNSLQIGDNNGMGILGKVIKLVDNSPISFQKYGNMENWPLKGMESVTNKENKPLPAPAYTALVTDSIGTVFPLSIYNIQGTVELKENDSILVLDPTIRSIPLGSDSFTALHSENPNFLFLNFKHWSRQDITVFYS